MCGAIGAQSHHPLNLERADALLAGQHEVHDLEPLPERLIRVFKNDPGYMREALGGHCSAFASPG
jgi:hypothetical protein